MIPNYARFWSFVDASGGSGACWPWTGQRNAKGYGRYQVAGKFYPAHRLAYEFLADPIPDGLQLDHLCRNPPCVNPQHLEPVTPRENTLRGFGPTAQNARKTHCPQGHPYSGSNLRMSSGDRHCKTCEKPGRLERKRKSRAAARLAREATT